MSSPEEAEEIIPNPDQIIEAQEELRQHRLAALRNRLQSPMLKDNGVEPESVERKNPSPAEPLPHTVDTEGKAMAAAGASVPIGSSRPKPSAGGKEEGSVIVARELAGNLSTSPEMRAEMRIDELKFSVINNPATSAALSHFSYRYAYDGVRYWGHIVEWWLRGSQGVGGLARRHALQAIANSSGTQAIEKAEKPNPIARNLWNRDWKEKATKQGKTVEE